MNAIEKVHAYIEDNIDLIDTNNWKEFFERAARGKGALGTLYYPDLKQVLDACEIDPLPYLDIIPEGWFLRSDIESYNCINPIKQIDSHAFYECENLKYINFPHSLQKIGYYAFERCTSLDNIDLSYCDMIHLGSRVFAICSSLTNIRLPNKLEHMGTDTFYGCTQLNDIVLPSTLKVLDKGVFQNCTSLKNIYFDGTIEQWKKVSRYDKCFVGVPARTISCIDGITNLRPKAQWQG